MREEHIDDALPEGAVARLGTPRLAWGWGINALAWSPDGATIAAAGGRHVALFDARDGRLTRVLAGHRAYERPQPTNAVSFSADGALVSFGGDNIARRWNLDSGECEVACDVQALTGSLSPDGRFVYALRVDSYRGAVHELATGRVVREVTPRADGSGNLSAWSPTGELLATTPLYGDEVTLWRPDTGERLGSLRTPGLELYELAFSPDGATLAAAANLGTTVVWSVASRERVITTEPLQGGGALYACPALSRRGVLAVAARGRVDLYDLSSGARLTTWKVGTWGGRVAFSPDGRWIAYGAQGVVRLFDAEAMCERDLPRHLGPVSSIGVSPDGTRVVSADFDGWVGVPVVGVCVWSTRDGARTHRWTPPEGHASVAPDASVVASAEREALVLRDPLDGEVRASWNSVEVSAPLVLDDCATVALSLQRSSVPALYDLRTRTVTRVAEARTTLLARSPDGRRALVRNPALKLSVRIVDFTGGGADVTLPKACAGAAFAWWIDPSRVVTLGGDGLVRACEAETGAAMGSALRVLPATSVASVTTAAASRDLRWLAVGDSEGVVRLVDLARRAVAATFEGHVGAVRSARFTSDGTRLLTGGSDTSVLVWALPGSDARPTKPRPARRTRA